MTSSLDYWDARWRADPLSFDTSWPDRCARKLELEFILSQILVTGLFKNNSSPKILEIGCGNLQLVEDARLASYLQGYQYLGVDGSPEALKAARDYALKHLPRAEFLLHDLTQGPPQGTADFLLSKRTLQNLTYDSRADLWPWIGSFEHGCLIEDYRPARENTDEQRRCFGRAPILVPDFNYPLEEHELARLDNLVRDVRIIPFMGYFYSISRVYANLPEMGHVAAAELSLREIRRRGFQPLFGPNVAIVW